MILPAARKFPSASAEALAMGVSVISGTGAMLLFSVSGVQVYQVQLISGHLVEELTGAAEERAYYKTDDQCTSISLCFHGLMWLHCTYV